MNVALSEQTMIRQYQKETLENKNKGDEFGVLWTILLALNYCHNTREKNLTHEQQRVDFPTGDYFKVARLGTVQVAEVMHNGRLFTHVIEEGGKTNVETIIYLGRFYVRDQSQPNGVVMIRDFLSA